VDLDPRADLRRVGGTAASAETAASAKTAGPAIAEATEASARARFAAAETVGPAETSAAPAAAEAAGPARDVVVDLVLGDEFPNSARLGAGSVPRNPPIAITGIPPVASSIEPAVQ
jgi:hypothetical protein